MSKLRAFLSLHAALRRAQAAYRRRKGLEPTEIKGGSHVKFIKGLFVGSDSVKGPMAGVLSIAVGIAAIRGIEIPGVPLTPESGPNLVGLGLGVLFIALRQRKAQK